MDKVSKKPRKVLITGLVQSNFIKQLYGAIGRIAPDEFLFDIVDLKELSGKNEYDDASIFRKEYRSRNYAKWFSLFEIFSAKYFSIVFHLLKHGVWSPGILFFFTLRFSRYASLYKHLKLNEYDLYHFHFPKAEKLDLMWHLKDNDFCVISFWGSDLFRTSDIENFVLQKRAVERANLITTHSIEMREIILSKFGRHLRNKIMYTKFPPHDYLYKLILVEYDRKKEIKAPFGENFGLDPTKKWIVIGHNGSPFNNHLEIISELSDLPSSIKEDSLFIIPIAYKDPDSGDYVKKLTASFIASGLTGVVFNRFLSWEDLAKFRCLTDVMIHLPSSDALSGAMTEAIYAGSKIVTGNWLPYSPLRNLKIELTYIDEFSSLAAAISKISTETIDFEVLKGSRLAIEENFFAEPCAKTWLPVLKKL
jgi:hypothetical protein